MFQKTEEATKKNFSVFNLFIRNLLAEKIKKNEQQAKKNYRIPNYDERKI